MDNQQTGLSSTLEAQKKGNSILALVFFTMGALHLYGMMRSRPSRTLLGQKATLVSSPGISRHVKVSIVAAAMALLVETLMF